ncbi:MAG TPA: class I SAM-dependent methyltransferase [Alphaproteobacteria bacterium]
MTAQPVTNVAPYHSQEIEKLLTAVREIDRISNEAWQQTLTSRKKKEIEFHDAHRTRQEGVNSQRELEENLSTTDSYEKFYGNKKYYSATGRSHDYVDHWIKTHAAGKVVLDYACGDGPNAMTAAAAGAAMVLGLDISPISIENARRDAARMGLNNTFFFQADAENTKLPDNSVDIVICSGMLHHLDLSYAFPELRRVMKPGGKILAVEALDYNPAIKLYRMMTPAMRTDWEKAHILSHKDLRFAKRFFDVGNVHYWHIMGILTPHMPKAFAGAINKIDSWLEKIPGIQMMSWIFTFELTKRAES